MLGINLAQVSFRYQQQPVLKNISLNIRPGDFLGITGINGSGKSTLLYLLNGLIPHSIKGKLQGKVQVNGINPKDKPVSFFSQQIGLVFQNPDLSLFNLTVREEITFANPQAQVANALKLVGLPGYEQRDPQTLSFGQKQKICLAAALALDTP